MRLLLALIAIMTLSACTTFSVSPSAKDLVWENGRGFSTANDSKTRVRGALDYQSASTLRFLVEVENLGDDPKLISSDNFQLIGDGLEVARVAANDPEMYIASYNQSIEQNQATLETSGAEAAVSILSAVAAISGSETKEQRSERERREANRELEKANAQQNINSLIAQKKETENTFLRKTTLAPGKKVSGFIQFQVGLKEGPIGLVFSGAQSPLQIAFQSKKM